MHLLMQDMTSGQPKPPGGPRRQLSADELAELFLTHGYTPEKIAAIGPRDWEATVDHLLGWTAPAPICASANSILGLYHPLNSVAELQDWIVDRSAKLTAIYFRGNLAAWRYDAALRMRKLEALQDQARPSRPRPPKEAEELVSLQRTMDLCRMVAYFASPSVASVYLAQKRDPDDPEGMIYLATKTPKRTP